LTAVPAGRCSCCRTPSRYGYDIGSGEDGGVHRSPAVQDLAEADSAETRMRVAVATAGDELGVGPIWPLGIAPGEGGKGEGTGMRGRWRWQLSVPKRQPVPSPAAPGAESVGGGDLGRG